MIGSFLFEPRKAANAYKAKYFGLPGAVALLDYAREACCAQLAHAGAMAIAERRPAARERAPLTGDAADGYDRPA